MQRKTLLLTLLVAAVVIALLMVVLVILQSRPGTGSTPTQREPSQAQIATAPPATVPDAALSPEELVRFYFASWNAKQTDGMNACRIGADAGHVYDDMQYEASIELRVCAEQPRDAAMEGFNSQWYENPADVAYVLTDYTIHYNDEGKAFYLRDSGEREGYQFWLVKETPDGGWRIAMEGY